MQINDKLAPDQLYLQSQNALEVIKIENEKYENLKADFQTNIIDASSLGSTATSLKNYAEDFCLVLDKAIEANEIDKADHEAIQKAIETVYADKVDIHEVLDGFDILGKIEEAKNKIQEIENRIDEINNMSWIEDLCNSWFGSDSVTSLETNKAEWEKVLEEFQNKEHRYDGIEIDTANLLCGSEELREHIWVALVAIEQSFIDGEYCAARDSQWRIDLFRDDILEKYGDEVDYLYNLKDANNLRLYSKDKIIYYVNKLEEENSSRLLSLKDIKDNKVMYEATLSEIMDAMLKDLPPHSMTIARDFSEGAFFMYDPTYYNNNEYILSHTNCYSYILGMLYFPRSIEVDIPRDSTSYFPNGGNQPGMLSGDDLFMQQYESDAAVEDYANIVLAGTDSSNEKLVELVTNDIQALGFHIEKYSENMSGGVRVALLVKPNVDFHWYIYDDNSDVWYSKHGTEKVTNVKVLGEKDNYGTDYLIYTDELLEGSKGYEKDIGDGTGYTVFVGEFYIY